MLEEVAGLPLHPLAVHAAVVFVPLLAIVAVLYALVPKLRSRLGWASVGLAVLAPATAAVAVISGDAFQQRRGLPLAGALADHRDFGLMTLTATVVLAVAVLALIWIHRRGAQSALLTWTARIATGVLVVAAAVALVYVIRAGDSGARLVWEQLWQVAR